MSSPNTFPIENLLENSTPQKLSQPEESLAPEIPTEVVLEPTIEAPVAEPIAAESPSEFEDLIQLSEGIARIPIAKKGLFHHNKHGIVSFTEEDFNSIKENFKSRILGFDPYPTFGHLKTEGSTDKFVETVAANSVDAELKKGVVLDIEEDGDVLYAITRPNSDTLGHILSNEYEYSSGEFLRNYKDKITGQNKGTVLARFALTNSPFIPFEDHKIEMFSESDTTRPENLSYSVVKLLLSNNVEATNTNPTDNMPDTILNEAVSTNADVPLQAKVDVEAVETPSQSSLASVVEQITSTVKNLYESKYSEVEAKYQDATKAYQDQVEALKGQLEAITTKFAAQEAVTQKFSQSLSNTSKASKYKALAEKGATPALIQKFSMIEDALESNQSVIKLSDSEGKEVESTVLDLIESLLVDSVNSEAPKIEQLGQTLNQSSFSTDLQRIKEGYLAKRKPLN